VIALAYVLRGLGDYLRTVFFIAKRTKFDAIVIYCGVAVCVVLYAVLIPRLGGWGAAAATLMAFGTMVPLSFWLAQRIRRYAFEWKRIVVAGACAFSLYGCGELLLALHIAPGILVAALCSLAFPVLLFAIGFFDADEKALGRRMWRGVSQRVVGHLEAASRP
jgi:O-antigen/teichoic acid export membrane protein